jgi:hypothetical protein
MYSFFVDDVFDDQEKQRKGKAQQDLRIQANHGLSMDQIQ